MIYVRKTTNLKLKVKGKSLATSVTVRPEDQSRAREGIIELQEFERTLETDRVERNFRELVEAHQQDIDRILVAEVERGCWFHACSV